jgi:hypothetical protein
LGRARFAFLAAAVALATFSRAAGADSPARSGAAELLDSQATALMQEHRYAEACPKLAESERIEPGTGVLLRLALCYELSGRTASAWSAFREAAGRAHRAGDPSLADLASKHADALEPRLARLIVRLGPDEDAGKVDVRLDGAPFAASALGIEVPIDPGAHTLQAAAPGRRAFVGTFAVADRAGTTAIAIDLGPASRDRTGALQRGVAIGAAGVGVAGVVAGTILGLSAMSNWNKARSDCTNGTSGCSSVALGLQSIVNHEALGSTIAFTVGAVGIVGAALLWWTAPSRDEARRPGYAFVPSTDGRGVSLGLSGSF